MAESIKDRLKVDDRYKNSKIIRSFTGMMLWLQHDEQSDTIIASNQEGQLITRKQFEEIVEGINSFLDFYGDEEIERYNTEADERRKQARQERKEEEAPKRRVIPGYVYLIRAENGLYKIGKAKDVSKRLKPFSVEFPMRWELVHSFKSGDYSAAEEDLHKTFSDRRDVGEWFKLTPEDVEFIVGLQDGAL